MNPVQQHVPLGAGVLLGNAAKRIFRPRAVLHREDADRPPRRQAAHGVRHVQPGSLLPHDDGPDVRRGSRLDDRIHGIADQELHALALEDLRHRPRHVHASPPRVRDVLLPQRLVAPAVRDPRLQLARAWRRMIPGRPGRESLFRPTPSFSSNTGAPGPSAAAAPAQPCGSRRWRVTPAMIGMVARMVPPPRKNAASMPDIVITTPNTTGLVIEAMR